MPRYKVIVDDTFHYQDPHERREQGVYETVEEALAVCRGLVDKSPKERCTVICAEHVGRDEA
jgi:hypothetical protein